MWLQRSSLIPPGDTQTNLGGDLPAPLHWDLCHFEALLASPGGGLKAAFPLQPSSPTYRIPLSRTQSEDFQGIWSFDDSPASSRRGWSSH